MIGMLVREQHGVHNADALAQKLLTQVRWRVDEQIALRQTNQGSTPRAFVVWIGAGADLAWAADGGHTNARAGTQKDELPTDISSQNVARHVKAARLTVQFSQSTESQTDRRAARRMKTDSWPPRS